MARTTKTSSSRKKPDSRKTAASTTKAKQTETKAQTAETPKTGLRARLLRRRSQGATTAGARLHPSRLLAELVGTFVLTLVVVAALSGKFTLSFFATPEIINQAIQNGQSIPSFSILPFVAGLALAALVLVTYRISNGFFNPGVVIGQMALRKMRVLEGVGYIIAQVLGAMLALTVATQLIKVYSAEAGKLLALNPGNLFNRTTDMTIFFAELLGAFILGLGIAAAMRYGSTSRALLAGASFVLAIGVAGIAGAGLLNPALAVGVGLVGFGEGNSLALAGIYLGGSTLGIVIGMALYALLDRASTSEATSKRELAEEA